MIIFILVTFTSHYACSNQNEILSQETVEITFVTKQDASLYEDVLNKEIIDEIPAFIKVNALEKIVVSATDNEKVYYKTIFNNKEGWLEDIYLADIKKDNNKKKKDKQRNYFPLKIYSTVFHDEAFVNNTFYSNSNEFTNRHLWSVGTGLNLVIYNDFLLRIEYTMNHKGEFNPYLHFDLPF